MLSQSANMEDVDSFQLALFVNNFDWWWHIKSYLIAVRQTEVAEV